MNTGMEIQEEEDNSEAERLLCEKLRSEIEILNEILLERNPNLNQINSITEDAISEEDPTSSE